MENENFKIQMIAIQALYNKYGFCPAPQQVKLLESDGQGTYILFRIGEHEYRCEGEEITNIDDQKKIDKDSDEMMKAYEKQEKQFVTKEMMLTEAYNAKRMEIEMLKGEMRTIKSLADDRMKEIERLEAKNTELKAELGEWESQHAAVTAARKRAAYRNARLEN